MTKLSAQTILTSARVSCYRNTPDYYATKNLAIGSWFVNSDDISAYVNHPTNELAVGWWNHSTLSDYVSDLATSDHYYNHGWAIPRGSFYAEFADGIREVNGYGPADIMGYFNECVRSALIHRCN